LAVNEQQMVRVIEGAPVPDTVQSPLLTWSDGRELVLSFPAAPISGEGDVEVCFRIVLTFSIGWPNEEVIQAHRLWQYGLQRYRIQEVFNSELIDELDRRNSLHPRHEPGSYRRRFRHFIIPFHDETFECIAREMKLTHDKDASTTVR
jgi:hypothetical protein